MSILDDFLEGKIPMYPAYSEKYGQGDKPGPVLPGKEGVGVGCGLEMPIFCNSCGASYTISSSCMKRGCPNCYEKWASKEARVSSTRLWMASHIISKGKPFKRGFRVIHAVVSMPEGDDDARAKARVVCKRHGLLGGLMVWHPFRKDEDKEFVPDGHVHYHVIGLAKGDILPGGLASDGDVVFKFIKDAERGDYRGFMRVREVKRCIQYLLTHCGIMKGVHTLTWWGCMSYNSMSNKTLDIEFPGVMKEVKEFRRKCKFCGSEDLDLGFHVDRTAFPWEYVKTYHPDVEVMPG